ncbi:MAG: glutathione S-transferase family protein, partial [Pseudomonadota bacterium]
MAITLAHYGMAFARDTRSVFGDADAIAAINPLTRIPALILDGGEVLIDSAAIIDHLDECAGPSALTPRSGPARRQILQAVALAHGTGEKAGAVAYERHFHTPDTVARLWEARCLSQARAGLAEMERRLAGDWVCGTAFSHADVMT